MNLKNNILKNATKQIVKKISKETNKNSSIDNAVNKVVEMATKYNGRVTDSEFEKKDDKKYMYLKTYSLSTKHIIDMFTMNFDSLKKKCELHDDTGALKFKSKEFDGDKIDVYSTNRKIGYIKSHMFEIGDPLNFESDVRKCSVFLNRTLLCKLKKYKSFGTLYYEGYDGEIKINYR